MLNPCGTFSFAVGSLSAAAASGGATCGLSFDAASLSGGPISGEPGGSGDGEAAGCCAAAPIVNAERKTPASQKLRGDTVTIMSSSRKDVAAVLFALQHRCCSGWPSTETSILAAITGIKSAEEIRRCKIKKQ